MKKLSILFVLLAAISLNLAAEVMVVGHRGSYWGVENTRDAFIKGATQGGYSYLETDVKVTKDTKFVCFHDDNLKDANKTSIPSNTLETLRSKKMTQTRGGVTYTGYICTVEEYLDICKQYGVLPLIELKWATGINSNDTRNIPALVTLIKNKGFENSCIILSSMKPCLQYIRQHYPKITCQYLVYSTNLGTTTQNWCKSNGCDVSSGVGSEINSSVVTKFHNLGAQFGVWTVNNMTDFNKYKGYGVDFITTDYLKFETKTPTLVASPTSLSFSASVGATVSKTFTVTGQNTTANISVSSSNNAIFAVSPTSLAKTGGTVTVTYKPTAAGTHTATITLTSSGAASKTVKVTGTAKTAPISFTQVWNFSEKSGNTGAGWATDFSKIRNMDYGSGKLYVVTETSKIAVINAQTGAYLGDLSSQGVSGGTLTLLDVKVVGEKIVACNLASGATKTLKVYVWDNDNSHPRVLLNTTNLGGVERVGDCLGIQGDVTNGALCFVGGGASEINKLISYKITNGTCSATPQVKQMFNTDTGKEMIFGYSPRVYPYDEGQYWVNGQYFYPTLFGEEGDTLAVVASLKAEACNSILYGNDFKPFKFKGTQYGFTTTYNSGTPSIMGGRAALFDASEGWTKAEKIADYPSAGFGTTEATRNFSFSSSIAVAVNGTSGVEMWVLIHNQGVGYFKHGTAPTWNPTAPQPQDPTSPTITTNTSSLNFSAQINKSQNKSLTITGANITGNISLALSGTNANLFTLSANSLASAGGSVTITYKPTAVGNHSATLTISASGATSQKVTLSGTGNPEAPKVPTLTKVWETTNVLPATDARYGTGHGGKVYAVDFTNCVLYSWDSNGCQKTKVVEKFGGAGSYTCMSDDAGNILTTTSSYAAGFNSWQIYTTNKQVKTFTFTVPTGVTAHYVHNNVGISGDVMSATGAVMYITPYKNNVAAKIIVKNGAFVSGEACPTITDGTNYSVEDAVVPQNLAQNLLTKSTFIWRVRNGAINYFSGTTQKTLKQPSTKNTNTGFESFVLQGVEYGVVPTGTNKADGFSVYTLSDGEVVASRTETKTTTTYRQSFKVEEVSPTKVNIYYYKEGDVAAMYTFEVPEVSTNIPTTKTEKLLIYNNHETLFVEGVEAQKIELFSVSGQKIANERNTNFVNISHLKGIFVVVVTDAKGNRQVGKIVK